MTRHRCGALLLLAIALPARTTRAAAQDIVIANVNVVDAASGSIRPDVVVVVRGGRIRTTLPANLAQRPAANATVIDGRGKYLIPGLWDMHVHTVMPGGREALPLYVANGVTAVRDMASDWDTLRAWRRDIAARRLTGPRILASGPYIEGGDVPIVHLLARTPAQGRAAVDSLVALGVDFIKVHGQLTPPTYFAIARRARERGIAFAGHVSRAVGAQAASDSGQRSLEHLLAIPVPCTPAESLVLAPRFAVQGAIGRCSSADLAPLYAGFVRNGSWITPTLTAMVEIASWPGRGVPGDSLDRYVPDALRRYRDGIFPMPDSIPPGADSVGRAILRKRQAQLATMHKAGVGILAGTDAPLRNSPPGFGLHEELQLMVEGGLSPMHALRAATYEPARWFNATDSMASIAPGMVADLVLLDANPLDDIRNTRRIAAVIAGGRLFQASDLRRLLGR